MSGGLRGPIQPSAYFISCGSLALPVSVCLAYGKPQRTRSFPGLRRALLPVAEFYSKQISQRLAGLNVAGTIEYLLPAAPPVNSG